MTLPGHTFRLVAAAAIFALGLGAALSAPSPVGAERQIVSDEAFVLGADGIDFAAVTGPRAPKSAVPACADPQRRGDLPAC